MSSYLSSDQIQQFQDDGYVILDGFDPDQFDNIKAAAERVEARALSGEWTHFRGKDLDSMWGVGNLLHPDHDEKVFGHYLASDPVLKSSMELLGQTKLRLGLTNMLVNPRVNSFAIDWHRDAWKPESRGEAEMAYLEESLHSVQWNAALVDESCLRIVPGTHLRALNDEEWEACGSTKEISSEMRVELKAGQTVYYSAYLLHRGVYPARCRRLTLHANFVSMSEPKPFHGHYNGQSFMEDPSFRSRLPEKLWPLHDNWLHFAEKCKREKAAAAS